MRFGFFYSEKYSKAENCGQLSESLFGYKTIIPIHAVGLYLFVVITEDGAAIWMSAALFVAAYSLEALYRRTLKTGWRNLIVIVVCAVTVWR